MSQNETPGAEKSAAPRRLGLIAAILAAGAILAATLLVGVMVGYKGGELGAWPKIQDRYVKPALARIGLRREVWTDAQTASSRTLITNLQTLEIETIQLSANGMPAMWALAEAGENLILSSRLGQLAYLDARNQFHALDIQVDMGVESIERAGLLNDPVFQISEVRTFDLLTVAAGGNAFDLYVSHNRFTGECFQLVVSRIRLESTTEGVRAVSPAWEDIFIARPCMAIKDKGMRFAGHEGGGRLVLLNPETLLLSIGVYQFDGVTGDLIAGMDPDTDLGKIIEISIPRRTGRVYAMGFRNPQGLLIASDGRIWETEHGPQGGDEVNLIHRGQNYGWPEVTYGTDYGSPGKPWPYNDHQGQHIGYVTPRFAFVPSIAISNIIEPDESEFPNWSTHLISASLNGQALFALKTEGDAIIYAERIPIGERLRDMISLHDGRIAIVTDSARLIFIRNADQQRDGPTTYSGLSNLPAPLPAESRSPSQEILGARYFHYFCGTCHRVDGEILVGPPLNGVLERDIGAFPGYTYSAALAEADGRWTQGRMRDFIEHRDPRLGETTMPSVSLYQDQFQALMTYLRSTRETKRAPTPKQSK